MPPNPSTSVTADRSEHPAASERIACIDALRGLVVLVLVPNVFGGFAFHEMARREPDSRLWAALSALFTHVPWSGASLWDLVMPVFVFLVGVSMALSLDRRQRAGDSRAQLVARAALRCAALVVLGLTLLVQPGSGVERVLPYVVLATGLPWSRWLGQVAPARPDRPHLWLELVLPAVVVVACGAWITQNMERLGEYDFNEILVLLGLAYLPAFVLAGSGLRAPARRAVWTLAAWTAAFLLYAPPPGVLPLGEIHQGLSGHWNNGTNVAAAFDRWLFGYLPRTQPYLGNFHGYQTLQFVPLVAQMLAGVVVGRLLGQAAALRTLAIRLAMAGLAGLALSGLVSVTLAPLVKSLWTPSWALFSTALCLLALAGLLIGFERPDRRWLLRPLTVLGSHAVLLYVISCHDRWRIVLVWERLLGAHLTSASARPVLESLLVLVSLWLLAYGLERARIQLRI